MRIKERWNAKINCKKKVERVQFKFGVKEELGLHATEQQLRPSVGCDLPIKRLIMNCRAVHLKFQEHSTYFVFGIKIWKA